MTKLFFMSVLIATMAIPMWTAADKNVQSGARRTKIFFAVFTVLWTIFVAYYYAAWIGPITPDMLHL
jgi:hypothetical protein